MSIVNDISQEQHEKELQVLRNNIAKLRSHLGKCADWLETANNIIEDFEYDEDDHDNALEMIAETRILSLEID